MCGSVWPLSAAEDSSTDCCMLLSDSSEIYLEIRMKVLFGTLQTAQCRCLGSQGKRDGIGVGMKDRNLTEVDIGKEQPVFRG